jgi:PAS domain S-box-containing protein
MASQDPEKGASSREGFFRTIPMGHILALDPLKICLIYLVFGILWIVFSDRLLLTLSSRQEDLVMLSSIKGVLFIIVTTALLFVLIRHFSSQLREKNQQLTAQEEVSRHQNEFLAQREAEWESIFHAIPEWIALITPEGEILRTNRAVESLFGIPPGTVPGKHCFDIIHGRECSVEGCPRRRMLESKKREIAEVAMRDGSGWLLVTVDPILNSSGDVVSAVHIVRDITERTRSLKAQEQAKKKQNLLNYMTFSDIQNQIFTLAGYQHLVRGMVTEQRAGSMISKQDEILQKITLSLKFSQSFQDLGLKQPKWQNANHVFLLAISHLDFLTIKHTVSLDDLEIFTDPLLEQVFQILADNSLTHGKTVTEVTFRYEPGTEAVTLFFEDDGVGIPEDTKNKIFEPDFQKKKGVGLFLAREILDTTGISIVETGESGKGARFEMRVPRGMWRMGVKKE